MVEIPANNDLLNFHTRETSTPETYSLDVMLVVAPHKPAPVQELNM